MEEGCSSFVSKPRIDGYVPCSASSSGIQRNSPLIIDRNRFGWMSNLHEDLYIPGDNEEMLKVKELQTKSLTHRKTPSRTNWLYFWSGGYDIYLLQNSHALKLDTYVKRHQLYKLKFCKNEQRNNDNNNNNNYNNSNSGDDDMEESFVEEKVLMEESLTKALEEIQSEERKIEEHRERFRGRMKFLVSIWDETFFSPFETIESSSFKLNHRSEDTYIIRLSSTAVGNITITKGTPKSVTHRRLPIVGHTIYDSEYLSVVHNQNGNPASCISPYYPPSILNYVQKF